MNAKTVAAGIFAVAVIAGSLYVYKQYKDIQRGEAAPAKAAAPAPAASAPPSGPAVQAFEGLTFEADEAAIRAKFGGQLKKVERQQFAGKYVDYVIPEYALGGVRLEVFFQMDNETKRLGQVLLRKQSENQPLGSYGAEFKTLLGALAEKHGKPAGTVQGKRDETFREEQEWVNGALTVSLTHSQTVWGSGRSNEMLSVRYFPTER
jgi:hypothetical protein